MEASSGPSDAGAEAGAGRRLADYVLAAPRGAFILRAPYRRRHLTFAAAREHALRFVSLLRREGLAPGERMILWGPSSPEWAVAFLGAMLEGVVVVPLDDLAGPAFAERVQRQVGARLVVAGRDVDGVGEALPGTRRVVLEDLLEELAALPPSPVPAPVPPEHPLEIVFTSGTTSDPKGVVISHRNVLANLTAIERPYRRWNRRLGWLVRRRPVVTLLPLSHMYGQAVGIFIPLMMGLSAVFVAEPGPPAVREALRAEGAWALMAVPRFLSALRRDVEHARAVSPERLASRERLAEAPLWRRILAFRDIHREMGWRFRCLIVGGAGLDPGEETAWTGMGYLVTQGYGLTETAPIVTLSNPFAKARGLVGHALAGQELKLGPDGEVLVRGENVTEGYLTAGGTVAAVDADGWFHTGDLGALDDKGRLRILGRSKDVIVTPEGLNVFPRDVEEALARDPRIKEAAVIAVAAPGGEQVHAVLLLMEPHRGDEAVARAVVERANATLASYQRVRGWTAWKETDLPRTSSTGKVRKRDLVAAVAGASGAGMPAGMDPVAKALAAFGAGGTLGDDARLADLGLSSLDTVELVSRLEGDLQVALGESSLRPETTVAELRRLLSAPRGAAPPRIDMPRWARSPPARALGGVLRAVLAGPVLRVACRPLRVRGREHLQLLDGAALLVGNHGSYLDAPVLFRALPARLRSRVAIAMATEPFDPLFTGGGTLGARAVQRLRYVLAVLAFCAFPMPRSAGFRSSLQYAGELADHGFWPAIFPEGHMSLTGDIAPFRGGVAILVRELRLPVVPFRIRGLHEVLPPGRRWPKPAPVDVVFGEPLRWESGVEPAAIVARLEQAVREL